MSGECLIPKILIVDDSPVNIRVLGKGLGAKYKVVVATDGEKALAVAASEDPPDLILLDIVMPNMSGYDVCKRLKTDERTKDIPVIFLTAKAEAEDQAKGLELGAVDFIIKPFRLPDVMASVEKHI